MKRKILFALSVLFALFIGYSCTSSPTQDYLNEYEVQRMIEDAIRQNNEKLEFTQWKIVPITVNKEQWTWNDNSKQYEAIFDFPELTEFIYEDGANIGYVFIGEQGVDEVQKMLPFVNTYSSGNDDAGNPITFTETISYDIQLGNPSTIAFFIKDSQLIQDPDAPQTYNFRIVLIW